MIYDKNKYRLAEIDRRLKKEKDPAKRQTLMEAKAKLKTRKEDFYIRYCNPLGRWVTESVPAAYGGIRGARKFEGMRITEVGRGEHSSREFLRVSLSDIIDFYLEYKMKAKKSYSAAKTVCNHIKRHLGSVRLDRLDQNPDILIKHFNKFPEKWSEKYIWNYWAALRAALNYWIKRKRLHLANPAEQVEIQENTRVIDYVPTKADFDALIITSFTIGLPDVIRHIYMAIYETGLRIGEILSWRVEDLDLREPEYDDTGKPLRVPCYTTKILKQGKPKRITVPMSKPLHEVLVRQVGNRESGRVWNASQSRLYKTLKESRLLEDAGVKMERPFHDFRKSMKTRLKIEMRLPKDIAKQFMGHQTDAMDDYYTKLNVMDLWCAVEDSWRPKK